MYLVQHSGFGGFYRLSGLIDDFKDCVAACGGPMNRRCVLDCMSEKGYKIRVKQGALGPESDGDGGGSGNDGGSSAIGFLKRNWIIIAAALLAVVLLARR